MKILCWNCRGLVRSTAIRKLRANIRNFKPDVVFLLEIILASVNINAIVNRLGFFMDVNVPPPTKWGGLLLLWRNGLDIEPVIVNSNVISIFVYSNLPYNPWLLKFVYCPAQHGGKTLFWENMNKGC